MWTWPDFEEQSEETGSADWREWQSHVILHGKWCEQYMNSTWRALLMPWKKYGHLCGLQRVHLKRSRLIIKGSCSKSKEISPTSWKTANFVYPPKTTIEQISNLIAEKGGVGHRPNDNTEECHHGNKDDQGHTTSKKLRKRKRNDHLQQASITC